MASTTISEMVDLCETRHVSVTHRLATNLGYPDWITQLWERVDANQSFRIVDGKSQRVDY